MRYPQMAELPRQASATSTFLGYRRAARIGSGESSDEKNMASDEYPALAPRRKRGVWARPQSAQGLIDKDGLCWVDGSKFFLGGVGYELELSTKAEDNPKRLVSMGANVIILPDKKYINARKPEDCGDIEEQYTTEGEVSFTVCDGDGESYEGLIVAEKAPEAPANGTYWLDTGSKPAALNRWSEADAMWLGITTCYVKLSGGGIEEHFREGDGVELSGGEEEEPIKDMMGSHVIWRKKEDGLVLIGTVNGQAKTTRPITAARRMPNLDFVIESGNRLWGCRYGAARNGEFVNEIYCSKLGDFKNWNVFQGISTDSWVGNCGSDGPWTGAANFLGSPVFFKEKHIHRVYGNAPSQYSITDTVGQGVQAGSEKSLVNTGNMLLYKSPTAVCAYDGALPTEISEALGDEVYTEGVAGSTGNKYYLSVMDAERKPVLLTYDMKRGIWHKEDDMRPLCWCAAGRDLFCIDSSGEILAVTGAGEQEEGPVEWETVTGEIGLEKTTSRYTVTPMPEEKYIAKISIRMQMEAGAKAEIWISYDGLEPWEKAATVHGSGRLRSFALPIRPKRCDWFRLKIRGRGTVRIYSIVRWVEGGSETTDNDGVALDF